MPLTPQPGLIAFSHIPKTAGQTVVDILRRNFGLRHIDCKRRGEGRGVHYRARDLAMDLRLYPRARSLHGHFLRPWIDYGAVGEELRWYTLVRDPVRRLVSQYQYAHEVLGNRRDLLSYLDSHRSLNFMVQHLSGADDLAAARAVLERRFVAVGLVEEFPSSLLVLRAALGYPDLDVRFARPKNVARSAELRRAIEEQVARHRDLIAERTALDQALFDHIRTVVWPDQVRRYGAARLAADRMRVLDGAPAGRGVGRRLAAAVYRNAVYAPAVALDRRFRPTRPPAPARS